MRTCEPLGFGVSSCCTSKDSFGLTILAAFIYASVSINCCLLLQENYIANICSCQIDSYCSFLDSYYPYLRNYLLWAYIYSSVSIVSKPLHFYMLFWNLEILEQLLCSLQLR